MVFRWSVTRVCEFFSLLVAIVHHCKTYVALLKLTHMRYFVLRERLDVRLVQLSRQGRTVEVRDLHEVPAVELVTLLVFLVETENVDVNADADVTRNHVTCSFDLQKSQTVW